MMTEQHKIISNALTPIFRKRLLAFAVMKALKFSDQHFFHLLDPEDLVHQAIFQTLNGERPWNQDKCPDLFAHLAGCIKSNIWNESIRKEHELAIAIEEKPEQSLDDLKVEETIKRPETPEEVQEIAELLVKLREKTNDIISLVKNKAPDLILVVTTMLKAEIYSSRELSEYLNTTVSDIDNKKAKLKRLCKGMVNT